MLIGKTIDEAKAVKEKYLAAFDEAIVPIRGRVSAEYRKSVCMNLLKDFLESNGIYPCTDAGHGRAVCSRLT